MDVGNIGAGFLHGHQFTTKVVIGGSIAAGQVLFVVPVHVQRGVPAGDYLFDPVPVSVIDEGGLDGSAATALTLSLP